MTLVPVTAEAATDAAQRFQTLQEVVQAAQQADLPADAWAHLVGGSETETTLRRNRQAIDAIALRPRVLNDVSVTGLDSDWFGRHTRLPVLLAGIGSLERLHAGGARAAAAAAQQQGVPFGVSSVVPEELDAVAAAAPEGARFYQLYVDGDDGWLDDTVARIVAAGYDALAVTVDAPLHSRRERNILLRGANASRSLATPNPYRAALDWRRIERLRERLALPLILKGIGTAADADRACSIGVDAVYISNHGGRQLDHALGSLQVLPEVVRAVGGRARVFVDGGFSRGTDVLKALALGADRVGIGRLYAYGLIAAGHAGVRRVLELLDHELRIGLALLGERHIRHLGLRHIGSAPPLHAPDALHSAFPLLGGLGHPA